MKLLLFALTISVSQLSFAKVWDTTATWDDHYRQSYKEWMKNEVTTDMFTNKNSKYYGIKVDCADVTYALRAVFSYENGLPYQVRNPVWKKGHKYKHWGNEIPKFDKYTQGLPRFIRYVNFLGNSLGTETLMAYDSYPIKISAIGANDIHAYKQRTASGFTRHAYNIVDVTDTGSFKLIWSNQQRKKEGRGMKAAEWSKLRKKPYKYKWGFRRMNFPADYDKNKHISTRADYGTEQFDLAKTLDENAFFKHVKKTLKTADENPNITLQRQLDNLCELAQERVGVIKSGNEYRRSINNRCMNYKEYDDYSTPGRDASFLEQFESLNDSVKSFEEEGRMSLVDPTLRYNLESLFKANEVDTFLCPVVYKNGAKPLSLKAMYEGLKNKRLSSHPNDNLDRRWGVRVGSKTNCKTWY